MSFLGAGDQGKGRAFLGGLGLDNSSGQGAAGGVGAYFQSAIEAFARVTSSIASGGTAASDVTGGRGSSPRGNEGQVFD